MSAAPATTGSPEADTSRAATIPQAAAAGRGRRRGRDSTASVVARLQDPSGWPEAAATLVEDLGFLLIGDGSRGPGPGHLVVGLRAGPTLRHFDPESISYYAPVADGARMAQVTRHTPGITTDLPALWGHVHVVDRIPVENRFLTFGGRLRLAGIDDGLTIAYLGSPVPIVRWGGHSQGTDSLAGAIGAFFGRLIVRVDFTVGAAARLDALPPEVLFAAFLRDACGRIRAAGRHGFAPSTLDEWLAAAGARFRADAATWARAEELLCEMDLVGSAHTTNGTAARAERPEG